MLLKPLPGEAGWYSLEAMEAEMRKSPTDRMNDYDAVVMGVLEPILVLSVMAVITFLVPW